MKNATELSKNIGKKAFLYYDGMKFPVLVCNVKRAYGHIRYEVTPYNGSGSRWYDENTIHFADENAESVRCPVAQALMEA